MKDICNRWKGALSALLFLSYLHANAQALEGIVNAEKAFAQTSVDKNTRAAFLEFFTDSTLAFNNGQPGYGRKDWEKRPEGNAYLFWWPVYADVAASGDFGYTTGPAVFGPDKSTKEVTGGIYYSSVWEKNADGQWKVLADMGSATYDPAENLRDLNTTKRTSKAQGKTTTSARAALMAKERSYNQRVLRKKTSFDASQFSSEGRVHRRGVSPVVSQPVIKTYVEDRKYFVFEQVGGKIASSNDMAFTYGKVKFSLEKVMTSACYMRVWKFEDGDWKIVLDVIGG